MTNNTILDINETVTIGAQGSTGTPYTIPATNTWSTTSWSLNNVPFSTIGTSNTRPGNSISISGEGADINVNGRSLCKAIDAIEERLAILRPDPKLEKEWEELKQLGDQYRKLEADIKEKMSVWDTLKKTDFDK